LYSGGLTKLFITIQATSNMSLRDSTDVATINNNSPDFIKPTSDGHSRLGSRDVVITSNVHDTNQRASSSWEVIFNGTTEWNRITLGRYGSENYNLTNGDYLMMEVVYYNSTTTGEAAISSMNDTNISSPTNGQTLVYDSATDKWVNGNSGGGGSSTLSGLTDTAISSPTNGQTLTYNSSTSKWENVSTKVKTTDITVTDYLEPASSGVFSSCTLTGWVNVHGGITMFHARINNPNGFSVTLPANDGYVGFTVSDSYTNKNKVLTDGAIVSTAYTATSGNSQRTTADIYMDCSGRAFIVFSNSNAVEIPAAGYLDIQMTYANIDGYN
jgi:hypothetical protein